MSEGQQVVAVTGVGGFIGRRVAEVAREAGHRVVGLELSKPAARAAEAWCDRVLIGDMNDPYAARVLCEGAQLVVHTAALVDEGGSLSASRKVNVDGTRQVLRAAEAAGVGAFVHLSSVMVYGFEFGPDIDEDAPLRGEDNAYCITKIESEREALSYDRAGGMRVVAIRAGDVYGPRSQPWVVRPLELMKQGVFVLPDQGLGRINPVYVDDLVAAIMRALERADTLGGKAFNVTDGRPVSARVFFGYLAAMLGRGPVPSLPSGVLRVGFGAAAAAMKLVGKKPLALPSAVSFLCRPHGYAIDRARASLGYEPSVRLDEGMARVKAWAQAEGIVH